MFLDVKEVNEADKQTYDRYCMLTQTPLDAEEVHSGYLRFLEREEGSFTETEYPIFSLIFPLVIVKKSNIVTIHFGTWHGLTDNEPSAPDYIAFIINGNILLTIGTARRYRFSKLLENSGYPALEELLKLELAELNRIAAIVAPEVADSPIRYEHFTELIALQ